MFNLLVAIIVSASIDSTILKLGDQTAMHLTVTQEAGERVAWPVFGETLQDGIEIIDRSTIDTTTLSDGRLSLSQHFTLTSFKDSLFPIKPIAVACGEDSFWTEPLALNVIQPFEIDPDDPRITDITPQQKEEIPWKAILKWLWKMLLFLLGATAVIWAAISLYERYYRKPEEEPVNPELLRPADEVALEKLDAIKAAKIWKDGKVKEYQTELTDVVREYISRRFDVHSTEKTSDETLRAMKPLIDKDLYGRLSKMLQLADLVKFAKWHTTPDENEQGLATAYDFVRETTRKPEEENQPMVNE